MRGNEMTELEAALAELAAAEAELARIQRGELPKRTKTSKPKQDAKPKQAKTSKPVHHRTGHGYWPTTSRIPAESKLVRTLPARLPARNTEPVITKHFDPMDRHSCESCDGTKLARQRNADRVATIAALMRRGESLEAACELTA
jgi:hypothetical protein